MSPSNVFSNFDLAAELVRIHEGGLVDHPNDPGGRTNFGITQATLDASRELYATLPATVDELLWEQAKFIYRHHYWEPIRGDDLQLAISLMVFDCAVNQGVARSVRFLQQALSVKVDGWMGAKTLAAALKQNPQKTLIELASRRAYHYMLQDETDDDFGLGWARRLFQTYNAAVKEIM